MTVSASGFHCLLSLPKIKMAESMSARKEAAILLFATQLEGIGQGTVPEGLLCLLRDSRRKEGESAEDMRHRIYRRFYGILWHGCQIGRGKFSGQQPTYVYPPELKTVIRACVSGNLRDYEDPSGAKVYKVTLKDLMTAKWPAARKSYSK